MLLIEDVMKRQLLATVATVALPGVAAAADLPAAYPTKAPPAPAPYTWTGCYGGLNAGGAAVRSRQHLTVPPPTGIIDASTVSFDDHQSSVEFTGGVQLGCNWQFDPVWVVGLEGDFNFVHARRSNDFFFNTASLGEDTFGNQSSKLRWLSTVRGRIGGVWYGTLVYATGGLAIGSVQSSVTATSVLTTDPTFVTGQFAGSTSSTRLGWTIGAGFERAITDRWSAKLEYLHFDLGTANYTVNMTSGFTNLAPAWNASTKFDGDIVRAGVNYKFN
jgi:outer membrane immunogenic protein